jgi:hypothetical protein
MGFRMSVVTNVILTYPLGWGNGYEEARDAEVNAFFEHRGFCKVDNFAGGTKAMETNVLLGAFNHLDLKALIEHLKTKVGWEDPEDIRMFVQGQEEEHFHEVKL